VQSKRVGLLTPVDAQEVRPLEAPVAPELLLELDELPEDELLLPLLEEVVVPDELLLLLELDWPEELPELALLPLLLLWPVPPPVCLVQVVQPLPGSPWTWVSEIESKQPVQTVARTSASATRRGRMPTVSVGSRRKVKSTTFAAGRRGEAGAGGGAAGPPGDHSMKKPCSEKRFGPTSTRPVKPISGFTFWQGPLTGPLASNVGKAPRLGSMLYSRATP
jgi:hypothetical protein